MPDSVPCPDCKFPNSPGDAVCRLCRAPLAGAEAAPLPPEEAGELLAWIICDPFPARAVRSTTTRLTIGRTPGNDFVLPHKSISSCHAVVRAGEGRIEFEDRSSNGSFLNGKRVEGSAALRVGDVLTIGPYDLEIAQESPAGESLGERTSEMDFASLITGLVEDNSLIETLQSFEFTSKTGTLNLVSGQLRGLLVLRGGLPWFANLGHLHDEEAVLAMLDLREGRYVFNPAPEKGPRAMHTTLTGLLLEHHRRRDEQGSRDV